MATINDLVIVYIDDTPGFYARIESISPYVKRGWWQVKLLALSFPLQLFTWILDSGQIDGEHFTMGGTPVRLESIVVPEEPLMETGAREEQEKAGPVKREPGKVVSLAERKKDK